MGKLTKVFAWSLGILLCWGSAVYAQSINTQNTQFFTQNTQPGSEQPSPWRAGTVVQSAPTVWQDLAQAQVIYLGETHDRAEDHQAQLQIIQTLYGKNPQLAIVLEMFQRPYQSVLDQYLAGQITETELQQQSEYDQRWGFPWEYYAPILRFAKDHQLPVIALNVPTEITHKVGQGGLTRLSDEERRWIPSATEIRTDNTAYRAMVQQVYEEIHQGHGSGNFENFFLAQVLWDETMAQGVVDFLATHPDHQVVVLAGNGHVRFGHGIPSRVSRRIAEVNQRIVILNPDEAMQQEAGIADYFWISPSSE